ncbi:MAG: hypothetical protein JNN01_09365 [Opitutaceae bacterium]|nr:hypothetical protein [Opitutaceae bacterium]
MYAAEVLSQLRSLNWLTEETRRVPAGSSERGLLQAQIDSVRARLPQSILAHHDQLSGRGQVSVAAIRMGECGACHHPLSGPLLREVAAPGCFGVCPACGVFIWNADGPELETGGSVVRPAARRSALHRPAQEPAPARADEPAPPAPPSAP